MVKLPQSVTRALGRKVLLAKKNSPHIFFVAGVVGATGSAILACRATLKLEKTLDEIKDSIAEVNYARDLDKISAEEHNRLRALKYGRGSIKIVRLYGPSAALGAVSIGLLAGSHIQLVKRNSALSATLVLVSQAYDDYRDRVRKEVGEEKELEIYRAISDQEVTIDGKKQLVKVVDPNGLSPYARFFDEENFNWKNNAELNLIFIKCQQEYLNHHLHAYGYVLLNEAYHALGMKLSSAGSVVGWLSKGDGDGYVDFGLFDAANRHFVNGVERVILLDFNVDGVIYDKIDEINQAHGV